jgi:hypothetical protein
MNRDNRDTTRNNVAFATAVRHAIDDIVRADKALKADDVLALLRPHLEACEQTLALVATAAADE